MPAIRRILVPTDFSDCSRAALGYALYLAHHFGASLDILYAWEPPRLLDGNLTLHEHPEGPEVTLAEFARGQADGELTRFVEAARRELGYSRVVTLLETGVVAEAIVRTAVERAADMIVMGTHGRTGIPRLLLGSVTEKVARLSPIPVLTIRKEI